MINPSQYSKHYRECIGFTNQGNAKKHLSGKDLPPEINYHYIENLNSRIAEILITINSQAHPSVKRNDMDEFCKSHIFDAYKKIKSASLIPKFNNRGGRKEEVFFRWMRGYAVLEYFNPALSKLFKIELGSILQIGDDQLTNIDTFKKTPTADLQIKKNGQQINLEIQSGFQGVNDIKEHKIKEARRVIDKSGIKTICIHFDLFNGQVAILRLDTIEENDVNFETREQMEGQTVLKIEQKDFKWRLLDPIPSFTELKLDI